MYPECWVSWSVHSSGNELVFLNLPWVFSIPSPHLPQKRGNSDPWDISEWRAPALVHATLNADTQGGAQTSVSAQTAKVKNQRCCAKLVQRYLLRPVLVTMQLHQSFPSVFNKDASALLLRCLNTFNQMWFQYVLFSLIPASIPI